MAKSASQFLIIFCLFVLLNACDSRPQQDWLTYYEQSNFKETPNYAETLAYCQRLQKFSPHVELHFMGRSAQGRRMPFLVVDKSGSFDPRSVKTSRKATVMLLGGIHSGEICGKDAVLMLLRDILVDEKFPGILDNVMVIFVPIFNVDGHERSGPNNRINQIGPENKGWRTTANNLNLNRDFLKTDAVEMRNLIAVINSWQPDLLVDMHTTDGFDHRYAALYSIETSANLADPAGQWARDFESNLSRLMEESGNPIAPYIWPIDRRNIMAGAPYYAWSPMYSTGYASIRNRPSLLIEAHAFKNYRTRVEVTYQMVKATLQYVNQSHSNLRLWTERTDLQVSKIAGEVMPLTFKATAKKDILKFRGYNFRRELNEIANDEILVWEKIPIDYELPYFKTLAVLDSAVIPFAYIIPPQWRELADRLRLHGVNVVDLKENRTVNVKSYRFDNVSWPSTPFEGRFRPSYQFESIQEDREYPAGSFLVYMNQSLNRLIAHTLEPGAPDSFVKWGFMNTIFEEKEYFEPFVLAPLIEKMIGENPGLMQEFRDELRRSPSLAQNPDARLKWFYQRSVYWDKMLNLYPIGKIMDSDALH